jgi:hypothetical protein
LSWLHCPGTKVLKYIGSVSEVFLSCDATKDSAPSGFFSPNTHREIAHIYAVSTIILSSKASLGNLLNTVKFEYDCKTPSVHDGDWGKRKTDESRSAEFLHIAATMYCSLRPVSEHGKRAQEEQIRSYEWRNKMLVTQIKSYRQIFVIAICCLLSYSCAYDFYQQRADLINAHVASFNAKLKADRLEAAILENEEIEEMAGELAESIRKRAQPLKNDRVDYELKLLKTSIEAAVKNWLALGQHLMLTKKYDQARAAYERIIVTYTGETERSYRERAARAKQDLDILSPPTSKTSGL